jgi:hypothetical protein
MSSSHVGKDEELPVLVGIVLTAKVEVALEKEMVDLVS